MEPPRDVVDLHPPLLSWEENVHACIHAAAFEVESVGDTGIRFDSNDWALARSVHHQLTKGGVGPHEQFCACSGVRVRDLSPLFLVGVLAEPRIDIIKVEIAHLDSVPQIFPRRGWYNPACRDQVSQFPDTVDRRLQPADLPLPARSQGKPEPRVQP